MTKRRRLVKQALSFKDRLAGFAKLAREKASKLPAGPERDALLKNAGNADTATRIEAWLNSTGLQPPK